MPSQRTPIYKNCERCGEPFRTKPSHYDRRKYCSTTCKGAPPLSFTCEHCGTSFTRPDHHQFRQSKYCSQDCWHAAVAALPADERGRMITAAQDAVRGMKRSHDDLCKRARTKQLRAKLSDDEVIVLRTLRQCGYDPVPLFAVDKYNIDFALTGDKIAIEYNGGNWHNLPAKREADATKAAFLESNGWRMIYVPSIMSRGTPLLEMIAAIERALTPHQADGRG